MAKKYIHDELPRDKSKDIREANKSLAEINKKIGLGDTHLLIKDALEKKPTHKRKRESSRYSKTKLSAETITVIKKALLQFKTKELEQERSIAIKQFTETDDFFMIMYKMKKRVRKDGSISSTDLISRTTDAIQKSLL